MERGGCPTGAPGTEGWSSDTDISVKNAPMNVLRWEGDRRVHESRDQLLYVDRTNGEVGWRTSDGGRVFAKLSDVLELLGWGKE